jgi:hypothetical protein
MHLQIITRLVSKYYIWHIIRQKYIDKLISVFNRVHLIKLLYAISLYNREGTLSNEAMLLTI